MRRAFKIYDWLGGDIYNLFSNSLASSIYAIPRLALPLLALHNLARTDAIKVRIVLSQLV